MALVREVIFFSTKAGSRLSVRGSTSANTTLAPSTAAGFAVAIQLIGVVMTSCPGPTPEAIMANCNPVVPEVTANPYLAPQKLANSSSKLLTAGPQDGAPARSTSSTASCSSAP